MLEPAVINRIRHIFLHPRPHVSISQATDLLGWSRGEMTAAIATGEIVLMETPLGKWIWREEYGQGAGAVDARGHRRGARRRGGRCSAACGSAGRASSADSPLPTGHAHVPRRAAADHGQRRPDPRELEGVASEHADELSAVILGFGAALAWPDTESPQLPC